MVKRRKAGAKAARPESSPTQPDATATTDQSEENLSEMSSPEDRRRKLPGQTDQQQGKSGTCSDDINPSSPGRHTAYVKGVNINISDIIRKHEVGFTIRDRGEDR